MKPKHQRQSRRTHSILHGIIGMKSFYSNADRCKNRSRVDLLNPRNHNNMPYTSSNAGKKITFEMYKDKMKGSPVFPPINSDSCIEVLHSQNYIHRKRLEDHLCIAPNSIRSADYGWSFDISSILTNISEAVKI